VFIPHIDQTYKLALYTNATDADANTFGNAVWVIDALAVGEATSSRFTPTGGTETSVAEYLNTRDMDTLNDAVISTSLVLGTPIRVKERTPGNGGGAIWDTVLSSTVTENTYNIVQCTGVATLSLVLRIEGAPKLSQWGALLDGSDDTAVAQHALDYAVPLSLGLEVDGTCTVTSLNIDKVVDGNTASATVPDDAVVDNNGNDTYFTVFTNNGGGFLCDTVGDMFDTNLTNTDANAPVVQMVRFENIVFESTLPSSNIYVLSPKYLRTAFSGCDFRKIKCLKSTSILSQSIYFSDKCQARRWQGIFFDNDYFNYDLKVDILMEAGPNAFRIKNPIGCSFAGSTIEGMSGTAIDYDGAQGLDVSGCYFEQNARDLDGTYSNTSSSVSYGVNLSGNYHAKTPFTVSGATQANPVVVTTTADHNLINGDVVYIVSVGGMTEINGLSFTVANKTDTTFELSGIDGTSYTAYVEDGNGRVHPYTVKWGQTDSCASIANRHTGAMHNISSSTDGLIVYDLASEKLSDSSEVQIIQKGYNGTYTGTLTGCTTSPTGTIRYTKTGDTVTLYIPSLTATSNTTACTITGMPSHLYPARQQIVVSRIKENSTDEFGSTVVGTDGVLNLGTGAASGAFTASGTKGAEVHTFTYSLT